MEPIDRVKILGIAREARWSHVLLPSIVAVSLKPIQLSHSFDTSNS